MIKKMFLIAPLVLTTAAIPLATTISCASSENKVDDVGLEKDLAQKALYQSRLQLESAISKFIFHPSNVDYDALNKNVLQPKSNFGFTSNISAPATPNNDDDNGTKRIKLTVFRSDQSPLSTEFDLKGFLTTQQTSAEEDDDIKIFKQIRWIPSHPVKMHTNQTNLNVRQALKILQTSGTNGIDLLKQVVNVPGDGNPNSSSGSIISSSLLVNQALPKDVQLVIASATQVTIENFATDQIKVIFQLVKGTKKSHYVELLIDGFSHDLSQDSALNLDNYIHIFQTWLNPLRIVPELTLPQPSQITNVSQLIPLLNSNWNRFQNIEVRLDEIISADNQLGSLKVKATFRYEHQPASAAKTTTISIYGFPTESVDQPPKPSLLKAN